MNPPEPDEARPRDLYADVTDRILAALERGAAPWRRPWNSATAMPASAATGRPYRGVNVLLLGLAPHRDNRWLTLRQANDLGGSVRKGETSSLAVFWKLWEPKEGQEEERPKRRVPVLRRYSLFNAEQCEGLPLPPLYDPGPLPEPERIARAETLAIGMPDPPQVVEVGSGAWYSPPEDRIGMPPLRAFRSAEGYYGTLFHELGHATGHPRRLARKALSARAVFGSGDYGHEELVAELASAFCCAEAGLDNSHVEDAASYIGGWLGLLRQDPKAVVYAAAQAQKAADWIKGASRGPEAPVA